MLLIGPAVVLGAFLLFLVQPLEGKRLLPLFGGSGAVWSACLLFFQSVLLVGYLYSHALTRRLRPAHQASVHAVTVLACLLAPRFAASSGGGSASVLAALAISVGLPYFLLSTTSPLLQHWYSLLHPLGKPYRLSAWGNAACALALVSFPFLLEPRFGLRQLSALWNWIFYVQCALLLACAAWLWRQNPNEPPRGLVSGTPLSTRLSWILWPALGSAFLMATTTHLCQVVAPAPLLWVVPMLMYLLSFVVVFAADTIHIHRAARRALLGLLAMTASVLYLDLQAVFAAKVALYACGLLLVCLFCHGELAALKPEPGRITSYWTHVAAGGALGSLAAGSLSAAVLPGYFELPLLMAAASGLCVWRLWRESRWVRQAAAMAAILSATPALAIVQGHYAGLVEAGRNFYGSLRVLDAPATAVQAAQRKMLNGMVTHGLQFRDASTAQTPTTYYSPSSAAGLLLSRPGDGRRVGIIGLGAGTLAAYGRDRDRFEFYELNPMVISMAKRDFTFLSASKAAISVIEGDARLSLAAMAPANYDVLVVDAFSGDSIPAHLLTREAFAIYLRHLRPGGTLALHISNQYLELAPAIRALAADAGRPCMQIRSNGDPARGTLAAIWMLVDQRPGTTQTAPGFPVWTDDWNSLLPALK
ncbi:MAG: fused MFS/spermidine synthase [Acidobacteria bacterium]|nr:fused MFS/spermidine synthase [Acidobacteriota bacterium]